MYRLGRLHLLLCALAGTIVLAGSLVWIDPLSGNLDDGRWAVWRQTLQTYESAPFGRGLGSFRQIFIYFAAGNRELTELETVTTPDGREAVRPKLIWAHAHNEYLQLGFEMGLQTMALAVLYVGAFIATAWTRRRRLSPDGIRAAAGMAAVMVSCLGWFTFHVAPLALVGMAWIGQWERASRGTRDAKIKSWRGDFAPMRGFGHERD